MALLPFDLRKIRIISYLFALIEPIKAMYNAFLQFMLDQLYDAKINGQVIKLERVLNDTFDPIDRRIFITDGEYYTPSVFYEEYKDIPVIFYEEGNINNPIFYSETSLDGRVSFNFFVNVPESVFFDKTHVRAVVNKYRIFGRTFDIILIP
ncbi:MAG TPA: hypothetical protein PK431_01735 [Chitinophagales bacterium]|nr:hypothetical protein [Chitinophagales bacterium]